MFMNPPPRAKRAAFWGRLSAEAEHGLRFRLKLVSLNMAGKASLYGHEHGKIICKWGI
jgi:hypothetical protein